MAGVKVVVRVRPFTSRERAAGEALVVDVFSNTKMVAVTNLKVPEFAEFDSRERTRYFTFDACYDWNTKQDVVFNDVGTCVLDSLVAGYNTCVLSYGQSGTGKTYTMMGRQDQPGLTPRICEALFSRLEDPMFEMEQHVTEYITKVRVAVCFLEIHNERVRDLLSTSVASSPPLKVREHPRKGPYVQGLSEHGVKDAPTLMSLLAEGNARRCTARTGDHARSSRSHAVFTLSCSEPGGLGRRAHLVDLAGSERAAVNNRVRREEGASINKSLVTLGNVISALAERPRCCSQHSSGAAVTPTANRTGRCTGHVYVPYRDSILTWLLRDSLGGNSKTYMIATVSPSNSCYSETVNTLRYAQRAKRIVNQPVVNAAGPEEAAAARTIRELQAEVARLREALAALQGSGAIKQRLPGGDREESLAKRWFERWQTSQMMKNRKNRHAALQLNAIAEKASRSLPANKTMGQNASSSSAGPQEALEAGIEVTEQPVTTLSDSSLRRTSSEVIFRRPSSSTSSKGRITRRYSSHDSIPPHNLETPLSPGGSENSLASTSSSSAESPKISTTKKKPFKSAIPIRIPTSQSCENLKRSTESLNSIRRGSSSSVPDLSKSHPKQKQADIVAAVTQRLYPKKKVSNGNHEASKDAKDETCSSTSSPEPCTRAVNRLRLFDLSKRLLSAHRNKELTAKTEAETQTDKVDVTKEAAVGTEQPTPEPIHAFITSEIFLPCLHQCNFITPIDTSNPHHIPNCNSNSVQPDLLASRTCHNTTCSLSSSSSVEIPVCFNLDHCEDDCFSDDSLDSRRDMETDSLDDKLEKPSLWKVMHLSSGQDFLPKNESNSNEKQISGSNAKDENFNDNTLLIQGVVPTEENWEVNVLIGGDSDLENTSVNLKISNGDENVDEQDCILFNGLPLSSEDSEPSRTQSSDDNNSCPSPISSDAASTASDSSSGDDFVYFLQAPEESGPRRLYTIAENSEHSDHSESLEPSLSPPLPSSLPISEPPKPNYNNNIDDETIHLESPVNKTQSNFSIENILSKYSSTQMSQVPFQLNIVTTSENNVQNYSKNFYPEFTKDIQKTTTIITTSNSKNFYPEFTADLTQVTMSNPAHTVLTSTLQTPLPSISTHGDPLSSVYVPLSSPKLVSSTNIPRNASDSFQNNIPLQKIARTPSPNLINFNSPSPEPLKFSQNDIIPVSQNLLEAPLNNTVGTVSQNSCSTVLNIWSAANNVTLPRPNLWNSSAANSPLTLSSRADTDFETSRHTGAVPRVSRDVKPNISSAYEVNHRQVSGPVTSQPLDSCKSWESRGSSSSSSAGVSVAPVQWADPRQRQFLNVSVVQSPSPANRAQQSATAVRDHAPVSTASEDSITFVYVGPARKHAPPVLLELVRRSVGGRGLQRSVSLDSATRALSRLAHRRRGDVVRACSVDTLVPEETHAFLEPARREHHGLPGHRRTRRSEISPSDSEIRSTDDDFEDTSSPDLPRVTGQVISEDRAKPWTDMKSLILGQPPPRPQTSPSPPPRPRSRTVGKKAVSWSDVSGCGLLSSPSSHSLPSPTSISGSPKPIIKKSSLAPVPHSPIPSPPMRSPQNKSPVSSDHFARRERLRLDLQHNPSWNSSSPDYRTRPEVQRSSPSCCDRHFENEWFRERSVSAPSSPYHDQWIRDEREDRSASPATDWHRDYRGPSMSAPSTPISGSPATRFCRSRSPPRCGSEPRCHSLGDVSELGRDAESLRLFLAEATTLLHSLSDLSRLLEQHPSPSPPQQKCKERAVQTEDANSPHECCPCPKADEIKKPENIRRPEARRLACHHRTEPIPIPESFCCRERIPAHCCCCPGKRPSRSYRYEPSVLERQLEASCARLEASLQQPPEWQGLYDEMQPERQPVQRQSSHRSSAWQAPTLPLSLPPLPTRTSRPHTSPRAYMRHLLGVRRRIIQASREDMQDKTDDL